MPDSIDIKFEELIKEALYFQKNMERTRLDSMADLLVELGTTTNSDHILYHGLYYKTDANLRRSPGEFIDQGEDVLAHFTTIGDSYMTARASNVLAHCYSNIGDHRMAVSLYEKAIAASKNTKEPNIHSEIRYRAGVTYNAGLAWLKQGSLDAAAELLYKAQHLGQELQDTIVQLSVLNQLGNIDLQRSQYPQALSYYKEAMYLAQASYPTMTTIPMMGISGAFQEMGELDSALYYSDKVMPVIRNSKDNISLCVGLYNLSELYLQMDNPTETLIAGNELLEVASSAGIQQFVLNGYIILGKAHLSLLELNAARRIISVALAEINEETEFEVAATIYKLASEVYEKEEEYKLAFTYQKSFKQYSDSMLNQQSLAIVDGLKIKYESQEKEQIIGQLESKNLLDAALFKQRWTYGIGGFFILGLSGLVTLLMLNRRRLKLERQKDNIEQRLLRSQMNPHFIFNAISSIQNYLYDKADLKVALNYMSKFAELMRQILENSREEFIPLSEEINSLENYLNLQQLRYNNSFGYKISIDPKIEINDLLVPPLIAQPFVENAIEHGMIYRIEKGLVKIQFKSTENKITLSIEDNGLGHMTVEIKPKNIEQKKKSLATIITKERLEIISNIHNSKFDLVVSAIQSGGTRVIIQLPKISAA